MRLAQDLRTQFITQRLTGVSRLMSTATASINLDSSMSLDDVNKLHRLQSDFEKDPMNMQTAYELFSQLNRHGKYNTVIRLYDKYELAYSSMKEAYTERMQSQYEFARDNIGSLGINLDSGDGTRVTAQNLNKILISKAIDITNIDRRCFRFDLLNLNPSGLCLGSVDDFQEL